MYNVNCKFTVAPKFLKSESGAAMIIRGRSFFVKFGCVHQCRGNIRDWHGHQIVRVSKALPLWRKFICHHKIFNTRQAANKICHDSFVYVCACLWPVSVRICVWVASILVCVHHWFRCVRWARMGVLYCWWWWGFWCCCWCRFGFNYWRNCACFPNKCRRNVRARQYDAFSWGKHDMFTLGQSSKSIFSGFLRVFCTSSSHHMCVPKH